MIPVSGLPSYLGSWTVGGAPDPDVRMDRAPAPPRLTGGADSQPGGADGSVSVHWVQGTVPVSLVFALAKYVAGMAGCAPELREWGRYRYDCSAVWEAHGIAIFFDGSPERAESVHRGRATLLFPGSALDMLDAEGLLAFLGDLHHVFLFRSSRVDVCWDDWSRRVSPSVVRDAAARGDVAGFRVFDPRGLQRLTAAGAVPMSDSVAFGRRGGNGGGRYLRVYDKGLESGGALDCVRWECEFSGDLAGEVFARLACAGSVPELGAMLGAAIGGCVCFLDRSAGDKNLSRCPLLPWWEAIVGTLGRVLVRRPRRLPTVERSRQWVEDQVSATLGLLRAALGDADFRRWLGRVVDAGEARLESRHLAALEVFALQNRNCMGVVA